MSASPACAVRPPRPADRHARLHGATRPERLPRNRRTGQRADSATPTGRRPTVAPP